MKYEIDRRYPFEATADSVCPVPDETLVWLWFDAGVAEEGVLAGGVGWKSDSYNGIITHFMVLEYPAEKHTAWLNVYPGGDNILEGCMHRPRGCMHRTRDGADRDKAHDRLACKKIDWFEGEGL